MEETSVAIDGGGNGKMEKVDILEEFGLRQGVEHLHLECKEAGGNLPRSFWETYSSFANTSGGVVILGVKENKGDRTFSVTGVSNPYELVKNLHDTLSNRSKVNLDVLQSDSVEIVEDVSGKKVILIYVPEASEKQKPIYLNQNNQNSYIRKGEADIRASEDELNAMIRNSATSSFDSRVMKDYCLDDLDKSTLSEFKGKVSAVFPDNGYDDMNFDEFLINTGFFGRIGAGREYYPTVGCIMLFGKYNAIKEVVPSYFLDYINYRGNAERWADRLSSDLPNSREMNIFNFYNMVYSKLEALDQSEFLLGEDMVRFDPSLKPALREALVNTLAHADYTIPRGSVKVLAYDDRYVFRNPGCMLIKPEDFFVGGKSEIRNEVIMKCFRMLHLSEREGMGGSRIFKVTSENKVRAPQIDTSLMTTELTIWRVDIAEYPDLGEREKTILRYIAKAGREVKSKELLERFPEYKRDSLYTGLAVLQGKGMIQKKGASVSTSYVFCPAPLNTSSDANKEKQVFMDIVRRASEKG